MNRLNAFSVVLFFIFFASSFVFSPSVNAWTCIPGEGSISVDSIFVDGLDLVILGTIYAGECINNCFISPSEGYGEQAVDDPVGSLQYQIDSISGAWINLDKSLFGQWYTDTLAGPTDCAVGPQDYNWAKYTINNSASPISVAGYVGEHIIYLRALIDDDVIAQEGYLFTVNAPEILALVAPPNSDWINYMPVFRAEVFDRDERDVVAAVFEIIRYNAGGSTGSFLIDNGPGVSSWGPIAINDGDWWWRAWAIDNNNLKSPETGYWLMRKDTVIPVSVIDQENGNSIDTDIVVSLTESDERSGVREGDVDVSWRQISSPAWGDWVDVDLPNNGSTIDDFIYSGVEGYEYQFRYRVSDNAGNWSDYAYDGTVTVLLNSAPVATGLTETTPDFCSVSPAYFFSWTYSDSDLDNQGRFDLQIDDSGAAFPSPEVNRSYSGLSNPSPTINNQAVIVLLFPQADYLSYGRTYNWRVRVYDENGLDSGWINGTVFITPSHHSPSCDFNWFPSNPNVSETTNFTDSSVCYGTGGSIIPCVGWNWTFEDGDPATSIQQNSAVRFESAGVKNITLTVTDGVSQCPIAKQIMINLLPGRWKEIRPWW